MMIGLVILVILALAGLVVLAVAMLLRGGNSARESQKVNEWDSQNLPPTNASTEYPAPSASVPVRYCAHCGAGLQIDFTHCPQCGAPVPD